MKIKQTITMLLLAIGATSVFVVPIAYAAECGGVQTSILSCPQNGGNTTEDSGVWGLLLLVINIMTAGIGVLAVAGIVYGGIMYSAAGDSAEKVTKARGIIRNVVIGMVAYALMYSGLNFLIPGGLF